MERGKQIVLVIHPKTTSDIETIIADPWTAIVFLFYDHDWEMKLIQHAIGQPHFYLGAMGGRKAHAFRRGFEFAPMELKQLRHFVAVDEEFGAARCGQE